MGRSDQASAARKQDPGRDADRDDQGEQRDRQLVERLKRREERAFRELVGRYENRIFGLMLRMIGNREEAQDLAQEVFVTVYRAIDSYRGDGRFYTWLYRIATNTCRNRIKYLKGRSFYRATSLTTVEDNDGAQRRASTSVATPEAEVAGSHLEQAIQRELGQLDPDQRLLIVLRDVQGLSYEDILRITGLPEGTLKSRLHRARVALKQRLEPYL